MYNHVDWDSRKKPYAYIQTAISLFKQINGKTIVEVGTMRTPANHPIDEYEHTCCMEGHSSILFALSADEFHTVDIDLAASKLTFGSLKELNLNCNWNVYNGDGIAFLNNFNGKIDLLFLDAWDIGTPEYAKNHLKAYLAAKDKLSSKHIILIDDTDINFTEERGLHNDEDSMGGKGAELVPFLLSTGYTVIFKGRQTCLINFN